jgi:type III pantothenate kinase
MARLLLVDIGNTRIKWAIKDGAEFTTAVPRFHRGHQMADLLDMDWGQITAPDRVFISCVAKPEVRAVLNAWVTLHWQLAPHYLVSTRRACGVINGYDSEESLGNDRWAAMIAAFHEQHGAVCVIDSGTAITIDVVNKDGKHLGGLILPGIIGMQTALFQQTALPPMTIKFTSRATLLGNNTHDCVSLGIQHTLSALFVRLMMYLREDLGTEPTCYLTGGDALAIQSFLPTATQHEPYLVLKGLALIASNA